MKDIKVKQKSLNKTIKLLDKSSLLAEKIKDPVEYLNEKNKTHSDDNISDYGNDKIEFISNKTKDIMINKFIISFPKTTKKSIKLIKKEIKKTQKHAKQTVKASKRIVEQGRKLAIETTKNTIKTAKLLVSLTASSIKYILASTKTLISVIISGGLFSVIIIIVIGLLALILSSCFGIFFSNEENSITMSSIISEINAELYREIEKQQSLNNCDDYEVEYDSINWREVIAIYSVKYSNNAESPEPIIYLNERNISNIKKVFWDMNSINSKIVYEERESETLSDGSYITIFQPKTVLYININSKTKESLMDEYGFSELQKKQVNELLDKKYNSLWNNLLYGTLISNDFVNIAMQEIGNIHGEKYWRWYGFNNRVSWCAIFVSWVANQAKIMNVSVPRFSVVGEGARWFKERGQWEKRGYIPKSGDLIFFDWEQDKKLNHVGIVEKVENDYIYVIEGNSNDKCMRNKYFINSNEIAGFGVINSYA